MNKITLKDWVGWGIAIVAIVIAIIQAFRNQQLEDNKQQIHNKAQIIQQFVTNNNYNLPSEVIAAVNDINTASGPVVEVRIFKDIKKGR